MWLTKLIAGSISAALRARTSYGAVAWDARKRVVDIRPEVRRQDDQPFEVLDALHKIADLLIGVPAVQSYMRTLSGVSLVDNEIHPIDITPGGLAGQRRGHRLSRAGRSTK
jgi:hypothetical protein